MSRADVLNIGIKTLGLSPNDVYMMMPTTFFSLIASGKQEPDADEAD